MGQRNGHSIKESFLIFLIIIGLCIPKVFFAQQLKYNPKGYQNKWNFTLTPFLLVPTVSGEIESKILSNEFGISPSQFVESLNGTIMVNGDIWKESFFLSPSYIFNHNEIDKDLWKSPGENLTFNVNPVYKRHIAEFIGGWRMNYNNSFYLDPFVGFRYTDYQISGNYSLNKKQVELSESAQYWDPIIGIKMHLYLHPRIPVEFKGDLGGFGLGSEFTWSTFLSTGYSVAAWLDIIAGFAALSNSYKSAQESSNDESFESITYGFDIGFRFFITGREKDPLVFKKHETY